MRVYSYLIVLLCLIALVAAVSVSVDVEVGKEHNSLRHKFQHFKELRKASRSMEEEHEAPVELPNEEEEEKEESSTPEEEPEQEEDPEVGSGTTKEPVKKSAPKKKPAPKKAAPKPALCYNQKSLTMLEDAEGFVSHIYNDATGHGTIGFGTACFAHNGCKGIPNPISRTAAQNLLLEDIKNNYGKCVRDAIPADKMTDNEFGALASFAYNEGCGEVHWLAAPMNKGDKAGTISQFLQFTQGGLLTSRREAEIALFKSTESSKCIQTY